MASRAASPRDLSRAVRSIRWEKMVSNVFEISQSREISMVFWCSDNGVSIST
jgi:hypothetical protein